MVKAVAYVLLVILIAGCQKKSRNDAGSELQIIPDAPDLIFPFSGEECFSGIPVDANTSMVTFYWKRTKNASAYEVVVKNLISGETQNKILTDTLVGFTLKRNVPFSWFVKAKSSSGGTQQSETYRFYNRGAGEINHVPFPADAVYPANNQSVSASSGKIVLKWKGSDIDQDIASYELYLGTSKPEVFFAEKIKTDSFELSVKANTQYFWKIISKDSKGNTSTSDSFAFQTKD